MNLLLVFWKNLLPTFYFGFFQVSLATEGLVSGGEFGGRLTRLNLADTVMFTATGQ